MDRERFRGFLQKRKGSEDQTMQSISIVEKFEEFLKGLDQSKTLESATSEEVAKFSTVLIRKKRIHTTTLLRWLDTDSLRRIMTFTCPFSG